MPDASATSIYGDGAGALWVGGQQRRLESRWIRRIVVDLRVRPADRVCGLVYSSRDALGRR